MGIYLSLFSSILFALLVVSSICSRLKKWRMKKEGYFVHWQPDGAESGCVFYDEGEKRLEFDFGFYQGEQFKPIVYVPVDTDWEKVMPDWAKQRKHEIMSKITKHFQWKCEDASNLSQCYWREGKK